MKLLLLLVIFLLSGCEGNLLDLNSIQNIRYNNTFLNEEDYKELIDKINNIEFSTEKLSIDFNKTIIIKDEKNTHIFNISNNGIKYSINDKEYYSKDTSILNTINSISNNYQNTDYFNINYTNNYYQDDNDLYVDLSSNDNYFIIYLTEEIYDFEITSNNQTETVFKDTLYRNQSINNKRIIIRSDSNIKISFKGQNDVTTTITPIINNDQIIFNTTYN